MEVVATYEGAAACGGNEACIAAQNPLTSEGHAAVSGHALHRRDLQHPQGVHAAQPADGDPRAARAAARARRRHPVPAGGRRRTPRARGAPPRLAGQAAARVHRRHRLAGGRLRKERDLPARPSRQRRAVAVPDRRAGEPRHLGARVREPRAASLHDQARRRASPRCTASTCTWGSSSAGGSGRSARCASASARRCPRTRRCSSPATSTTGGTRPTACWSRSSASSRSSRRCAAGRRARFRR